MKLDTLMDTLLSEIRKYGILEISMEQYQVVCNEILRFANWKGVDKHLDEIIAEYTSAIEKRCSKGEICAEYLRFQKRVLRMITSLVNTGNVDFTSSHSNKKYIVSSENTYLISRIIDENKLTGESQKEMDTVIRHFFSFIEAKGFEVEDISDDLIIEFLTTEMPTTNKGSIGRTLRGIRYVSSYLKAHHLAKLVLDFNQLKIKTNSAKMIQPYTQEEINQMIAAVDCSLPEGIRDYAILMLGFDTGLRGVDIRKLCLSDIDWKTGNVKISQSKTAEPLILPLNGKVMNAIADYILQVRPESDCDEIFLTVKKPIHPMNKRAYPFSGIIHKYCDKAGVERKPMRAFHSLRRSFATELSVAGVPLETISQLLGHRRIDEDKPYLSYNREQIAFCAMNFDEIPLEGGIYAFKADLNSSAGGGNR